MEEEMENMQPLYVCVKAAVDDPFALGDCQSSQTVLLILEEKDIPYEVDFINVNDMPEWFLRINPDGKLPAVKIDDKWLFNYEAIADKIEDRYPIPSLAPHNNLSSLGSKIFPSFVRFLKSSNPHDGSEVAMVHELQELEDHLKKHGPYAEGEDITMVDLKLAPQIYQMEILLTHFKKWKLPRYLGHVENYYELLYSRLSFIKTRASKEAVIAAWRPRPNA